MGIAGQVERLTRTLRRRVQLMVGRAVLAVVNDETLLQSVQVEGLRGEVLDRAERFQDYGLTSHPHPGAEVVVLAAGGQRQHPLAIAVDDRRHRPRGLAAGEVCLYTDEDEAGARHRVILRRGRIIEIHAAHIRLCSSSLTHNGTNIGDTHTHGSVSSGPSRTSGPG